MEIVGLAMRAGNSRVCTRWKWGAMVWLAVHGNVWDGGCTDRTTRLTISEFAAVCAFCMEAQLVVFHEKVFRLNECQAFCFLDLPDCS